MGLTRVSGDILQTPLNVGVVTATEVNVGSAVTIHTGGFQVGTTDIHSTGAEFRNINSTGVSTFSTLRVGTAVTISGGIVSATSFVGDGTNLTNTGSTLSAASGSQRVVLTGQTSGTMTSSATSAALTFNAATGALSATSFSGSGANLTGIAATTDVRTNSLVVSGVTTATGGVIVAAGSTAAPSISPSGDSNTGIFFPSPDTIAFAEGGVEALRVDSSGRLLVNTSTARSNFRNGSQTAWIQLEGTNADTSRLALINNSNTDTGILYFARSKGTTIGSNTVVQSGDYLGSIIFSGNDGSEFVDGAFIDAIVDGTPGANDLPTRLVLGTCPDNSASAVERMRIDNQGRIGFNYGSTNGVLNNWGYGGYYGLVANTNSTTLSDQRASWFLRGSLESTNNELGNSVLLIQNTGGAAINIGDLIKGYRGSSFIFRVSGGDGSVRNSSGSYAAISDERIKQDIIDAESQWDDIKAIRVRKFKLKENVESYGEAAPTFIGVIAQELEQISPGLVDQAKLEDGSPDPESIKSVKYSILYMKSVKALQEAQQRIETLETQVLTLAEKVKELESKIT